jgi:hypothetical protein
MNAFIPLENSLMQLSLWMGWSAGADRHEKGVPELNEQFVKELHENLDWLPNISSLTIGLLTPPPGPSHQRIFEDISSFISTSLLEMLRARLPAGDESADVIGRGIKTFRFDSRVRLDEVVAMLVNSEFVEDKVRMAYKNLRNRKRGVDVFILEGMTLL